MYINTIQRFLAEPFLVKNLGAKYQTYKVSVFGLDRFIKTGF